MKPILLFILLGLTALVHAQDLHQVRVSLRKAYAAGNMNAWEALIEQLKNGYARSNDIRWLENLAWAEYGYAPFLINNGQKDKAARVLNAALEHADSLLARQPNNASYMALKSSLTAFRIQLRPLAAPLLGPRAVKLIDDAMAANPKHYRVLTEKALAKLYAPAWAGGNPAEATELFAKAAASISQNTQSLLYDWYYLNLMASYGISLQKTKQYERAVQVYKQTLSIEPNFQWVKNELLPQAQTHTKK